MIERAEKHRALRHAGIYLLARGLPGIIAFLAIPLFTRLLDPAAYGKYALVLTSANLLSGLLFQGFALSLVRFLPAYEQNPDRLKSTVLTLGLLVNAGIGLCAAAACLAPPLARWRGEIAACWLVLVMQQPFDIFNEYARACLRPLRVMGLQVARAAITVLLGTALIAAGAGWWGALVGASVAMAIPNLYAHRRDWAGIRLGIDRQALGIILRYGLPLSLTVALASVIYCSDRFLIAWFLGESAAGLYSAAVDFTARTLTLVLMVISSATFPLAVRALETRGPAAARQLMTLNVTMLIAIGIPAVAAITVLTGSIAQFCLGASFRQTASQIMPLVALGSFLAGFKAFYWDAAFQLVHRTIYQVWIVLFIAVLNIALNAVAIPRLGIVGAAGASVLAYSVSIAVTIWLGRRHFALPFPLKPFLQVLAASASMAVALYPMRGYRGILALACQMAVGGVVYGAALLALNFMRWREGFFVKAAGPSLEPARGRVLMESHG